MKISASLLLFIISSCSFFLSPLQHLAQNNPCEELTRTQIIDSLNKYPQNKLRIKKDCFLKLNYRDICLLYADEESKAIIESHRRDFSRRRVGNAIVFTSIAGWCLSLGLLNAYGDEGAPYQMIGITAISILAIIPGTIVALSGEGREQLYERLIISKQ